MTNNTPSNVVEALRRAIDRCEGGNSAKGKKYLAALVICHADTILADLSQPVAEETGLENTSKLEREQLGGHRLYCSSLPPDPGECDCGFTALRSQDKNRQEPPRSAMMRDHRADIETLKASSQDRDAVLKCIRSDVFEVLRKYDVSDECFAAVASVTQAYLKGSSHE